MPGWYSESPITAFGANPGGAVDRGWRSTVIQDAHAQAALQPWIEMECYQLSPGRHLAHMDSLNLGGKQVVQERQVASVQKLGTTPPNLCTISYCTPDPAFRFNELGSDHDDSICFMPGNTEFDLYVPAGAQTAYISLDQDKFLSGARVLNPTKWDRTPQQLISFQTKQQSALAGVVSRCLRMAETATAQGGQIDTGMLSSLLMQDVLQVACEADQADLQPSNKERSRALRLCRTTRDFVEDRLASDVVPSIVDICSLLCVSERTLQYAFRIYVDMPPLAYLRLCRLNRVRSTLHTSDPQSTTVTSVAMRLGFLHLGRFSREYCWLFGETPSATLAI